VAMMVKIGARMPAWAQSWARACRRFLTPPAWVRYQKAKSNKRYAQAERRFLVVSHSRVSPYPYEVLLKWLAARFPSIRARFELQTLPCHISDWSPYILHIPWLQDPVQDWSQKAYDQALRLSETCEAHRVPIINRVETLVHAAKSTGSRLIASAGLRTPPAVRIEDSEEFKKTLLDRELPLIVREDWGHGSPMRLVRHRDELLKIPFHKFSRPIAVKFIDTQSPDGLYRKYRYTAVGDEGIPQSLHVQRSWVVRGVATVFSEALKSEEVAYLSRPDPNHETLQRARRALGFDFVAFDYSYARDGQMVVWEANPFPTLHIPGRRRSYRRPAVERIMAAMAKLYLSKSGLPVDPVLNEILGRPGHEAPPVGTEASREELLLSQEGLPQARRTAKGSGY